MEVSATSAVVILLLVIDPLGNIPIFVSLLKNIDPRRRTVIVIRECVMAYAVLVVFVFFGERMLKRLRPSDSLHNIAGGRNPVPDRTAHYF